LSDRKSLAQNLSKLEALAKGSKLARLLHKPKAYISAIFFRKFIYPKNRKGRLVEAKTFFGAKMQLLLPAGMDLYLLGCKTHESEIRLSQYLIKNLSEDALFIDAGAHFGFYSLLANRLLGDQGKVISVEASQAVFEILKQNVPTKTNRQLIHAALTKEASGSIEFTEFPILYSEYNTLHQEQFEGQDWYKKNPPQQIKVEAKTLDSILEAEAINRDIFIKIDVEGAEFEVIQGLSTLLSTPAKAKLTLVMEYWAGDENQTQNQHLQAVKFLKEAGLKAYYINKNADLEEITDFSKLQKSENIVFKV
jgi:FkbM family methyltransferase